jgi:hypothetical protein
MMNCSSLRVIGALLGALMATNGSAQDATDLRTLLLPQTMTAISNELSGAQAFKHVMEITPYERNRPPEEYGKGTYREAEYMAAKASEYGFDVVTIERFPQELEEWDGEMAELWIEEPVVKLVTRYRDIAATLAPGSRTADVRAELIYVGPGDREDDYQGKAVEGKIVLASGPVDEVHDLAVRKFGAAGVASFYNGSGKPEERPDQIAWGGLSSPPDESEAGTFGFLLSHRMGTELVDLLRENPKVVAHAKLKTARYSADLQVVVATIVGSDSIQTPEKSEVVFIAHLFEGIAKQGANDNAGGPAVQLELGRAWIQLVKQGVLPAPKRTVRFLWVPEHVGTRAYIERYPDFLDRVLGVINMDMVGANQTMNKHSLNVVTTPYSLPSFVNDLAAQFMEFVGDTNRARVTNRGFGFGFRNPIFDPMGSRDPFWYHIEKFSFGSDHEIFTEASPRVPAVAFNNFHDFSYHTSEDSPRFLDPTQMKRAGFIGLAMGQVMANARGKEAVAIATLSASYGQRRLGEDLAAASMLIAGASKEEIHIAYQEARNLMQWANRRERAAVSSAMTMIGNDLKTQKQIRRVEEALAAGEGIDLERVEVAYQARCSVLGVEPVLDPPPTHEEKKASRLFPRRQQVSDKDAGMSSDKGDEMILPTYYAMEARHYADGKHSILDVRNAISAEYGPVSVKEVVAFFRDLERSGTWIIESR